MKKHLLCTIAAVALALPLAAAQAQMTAQFERGAQQRLLSEFGKAGLDGFHGFIALDTLGKAIMGGMARTSVDGIDITANAKRVNGCADIVLDAKGAVRRPVVVSATVCPIPQAGGWALRGSPSVRAGKGRAETRTAQVPAPKKTEAAATTTSAAAIKDEGGVLTLAPKRDGAKAGDGTLTLGLAKGEAPAIRPPVIAPQPVPQTVTLPTAVPAGLAPVEATPAADAQPAQQPAAQPVVRAPAAVHSITPTVAPIAALSASPAPAPAAPSQPGVRPPVGYTPQGPSARAVAPVAAPAPQPSVNSVPSATHPPVRAPFVAGE